ncbi:MAG: biotin-dependent carboxyltransferase family protein [Nocardioidaceae bacterium]|nr:biotin-dependent carboxyltransferase family protein [Nocardioidaceae bacterium]
MGELVVRSVGGPVLVQDAGRPGYAAIGVGVSGAADLASYALGNRLVGNRPGAAALEVVLGGLEVEATATTWVTVTGAPAALTLDGRLEPSASVVALRPGQRLGVGVPASGLRCYLAVRGGIAVAPVLGSRSRDTLSALGPEPVTPGARLPVGDEVAEDLRVDAVPPSTYDDAPVLRVVLGPRAGWISDPDALVRTRWTVGPDSDRVALRLTGGRLERRDPDRQLPSEGLTRGAIQVPPGGEPIVFGADHPVTGGYPVVGVVVSNDTDRLAQLRPGETVGFRWQ